jgi:outer membrane lipoprotein-sorting protein
MQGVRDVASLSRVKQDTPAGTLDLTVKTYLVLPDKYRQDVGTPFGDITLIVNGDSGWQKGPQGIRAAPAAFIESVRRNLARSIDRILPEVLTGARTAQFLETVTLETGAADVVLVTDPGGDSVRLFVDQQSGYVVKQEYQGEAAGQGPVAEQRIFSDFRTVGALVLPHRTVVLQDGKQTSDATVVNIEINAGVDPTLFQQPGP